VPHLSSLVFLGVIHCSRHCEQHHCLHHDSSTSKTTTLPPPPLPLLRSKHKLHHQKVLSPISSSVKNCLHRTLHMPLQISEVNHAPPICFMRLHTPDLRSLTSSVAPRQPSDVIKPRHHYLLTSALSQRFHLVSLLTSALNQRLRHHHRLLTTSIDR